MKREQVELTADIYYAIIPEWVLYADISANAVRLYGVLRRHADKSDGTCHPTRARLAVLCRFSRATVDRALDELVAAHAIRVINRKTEKGDYTSNQYVVLSSPPRGVYSSLMTPLSTGDETGLLTGDEQTTVSINHSQERRARQKTNAGDEAARQWWEQQNPKPAGKGAWHSLVRSCRAVSDRGWNNTDIVAALNRIKSVPSVAQLDRELRSPRVESWSERKAREEREERERIAKRQEAERLQAEEDRRRREEERAQAVPPPPEFREMVARLRGGKS